MILKLTCSDQRTILIDSNKFYFIGTPSQSTALIPYFNDNATRLWVTETVEEIEQMLKTKA